MGSAQAGNSVCSLPPNQPRFCRGWSDLCLPEAGKPAAGWGGAGGEGRSKDTMTCPQVTSCKSGEAQSKRTATALGALLELARHVEYRRCAQGHTQRTNDHPHCGTSAITCLGDRRVIDCLTHPHLHVPSEEDHPSRSMKNRHGKVAKGCDEHHYNDEFSPQTLRLFVPPRRPPAAAANSVVCPRCRYAIICWHAADALYLVCRVSPLVIRPPCR
jgi:hypothetical protein